MVFNCAVRLCGRSSDELTEHLMNDIGPALVNMVASIKRAQGGF